MPKKSNRKTRSAAHRTTQPAKKRPVTATVKTAENDLAGFPRKHKEQQRRAKMPNVFVVLWRSLEVLKRHWKLFLGIVLIYGILNLVLVRGLSGGTDLSTVKSALRGTGSLTTGASLFLYLLGGSGNTSSAGAGSYQMILVIIISLALVWSLRQVYAESQVRIRDAFYKGMYPLVPVILILLVIGLQLLPLIVGATVYSIVMSNGIAVGSLEHILWFLLLIFTSLLSLYMLCSSTFALYIATLPDMTPMKALKSARELVKHRRFLVARKILFLPLAMLIMAAIVMIPLILVVTPFASWAFFILSMIGLAVAQSYMYALYRELLINE
jgi:hypothetical protein